MEKKAQYASPPNQSKTLDSKVIIRVQSFAGTFLHYIRAVDPTILPVIN